MKKILCMMLTAAMLLTSIGLVQLTAFAATEELLENGNLEEGDDTGFFRYGAVHDLYVDGEYAHSGDYGMLLENRADQYANRAMNITDIVMENGPGEYKASVWVRLRDNDDGAGSGMLVINFRHKGETKDTYRVGERKVLTTEWQLFTFEGELDFDLETGLDHCYIYAQVQGQDDAGKLNGLGPAFCLDDLSLVKISAVNGVEVIKPADVEMTHINALEGTRSETTSVGAIRWDAWYTHDGKTDSVISQVERSLSPAKYHFRAPFYAEITQDGGIIVPQYTQEEFDKEMEYAIEAGIDYFGYVWYNSDMRAARDFHTTSKYKNDVKLCAIFDGNAIGKKYAREEMAVLLKEDYYMTVMDGRPLMYYFGESGNISAIADDIEYYRGLCVTLGIPAPFAVVMSLGASESFSAYADAVSNYAIGGAGGISFRESMNNAVKTWDKHAADQMQFVPTVTTGWHNGPRIDNPVTWTKPGADSWVEYATDAEIQEHMENALWYMQQQKNSLFTMANTVMIYAWNEHDEGGWICPTLAVDENGNQLYNEDGSKKINDGRIQAVKAAITKYKNGEALAAIGDIGGDASATPEATVTAKPTEPVQNQSSDGGKTWIWFVVGGVVVVAAAAVVVVLVIKKKKAGGSAEEPKE